jgi:carbamoylphosphate synthase large subunit
MTEAQQRDRSREKMVKVAVAENLSTAELIKQTLAEAGVPCLVKNTSSLGVIYGGALGGSFALQVYVLEGDEAAAIEALGGRAPEALPSPSLPPRRRYRRRR